MPEDKLNVEALKRSEKYVPHYIRDQSKRINSKRLYVDPKDIEQIKAHTDKNKPIRVSRSTEITDRLINQVVEIHNGNTYIKRRVEPDMVGRKFGEFAVTRKPVKFPAKKKLADMKKKAGK